MGKVNELNQSTFGTKVTALVLYEDNRQKSRQASVLAARFLQDTMKVGDPYEITGFNSEHLAVLCRTVLARYVTGISNLSGLFCYGCARNSGQFPHKLAN